MSFVNSIATTKGGRHVEHVSKLVENALQDTIKKKNKGGIVIKPHQIKNHLWVFVNCLIVNPTFDSQTKENMTLQVRLIAGLWKKNWASIFEVLKVCVNTTLLSLLCCWQKLKFRSSNLGLAASYRTNSYNR